jgi:PAS domain S-box-containing protein
MKRQPFPYAALFDAIPIGLYRRTPEGRLTDVNRALLQASGWPDEKSLLGIDVRELYADHADLERLQDLMARDGVVRNFETQLRRHHDPPLWVEINAVAVRDENGNVTCYEGTLTPIVQRKEMEFELRRSEQRMRAIMNALDEVVVIVDRDTRFVSVLGHRLREMGLLPHTVVGKTAREVFGKEAAHIHETAGRRALAGERVVYEWQTELPGTPHWFQISLFPLRETDGDIAGLVCTAYDMTHLKQTQEKLAHALAEKDALLKEVHHRVKNNLQIISSLLSLQFDRVQDPGLRAMVMESQHRIRAMALVHEQLYRSETLMRLDTRVFLDSLVGSLVRSSGQQVDANIEADSGPLDLDVAIPIALVINELVSNSLKHAFAGASAPAPRLCVSLKRDGDGHRTLVVRDNGVGLPPGFDIDTTPTLGLSLVTNLVRQIGGTVTGRTEGGTEFVVVF